MCRRIGGDGYRAKGCSEECGRAGDGAAETAGRHGRPRDHRVDRRPERGDCDGAGATTKRRWRKRKSSTAPSWQPRSTPRRSRSSRRTTGGISRSLPRHATGRSPPSGRDCRSASWSPSYLRRFERYHERDSSSSLLTLVNFALLIPRRHAADIYSVEITTAGRGCDHCRPRGGHGLSADPVDSEHCQGTVALG